MANKGRRPRETVVAAIRISNWLVPARSNAAGIRTRWGRSQRTITSALGS
jgi:hypothetical protein